jgi:hypothetical protein
VFRSFKVVQYDTRDFYVHDYDLIVTGTMNAWLSSMI